MKWAEAKVLLSLSLGHLCTCHPEKELQITKLLKRMERHCSVMLLQVKSQRHWFDMNGNFITFGNVSFLRNPTENNSIIPI